MEKSNSTFSGLAKQIVALCFLLLLTVSQQLHAQCSLGLNTSTQISLDQNCTAEITPEIVLNDQTTTCPNGVFVVSVTDLDDVEIPTSPIVTGEYVNQQLIVVITDTDSGNTGWGYINIEDKLAPVITCVDVTIDCNDVGTYEPTVIDACDPNPTLTLISSNSVDLDCNVEFIEEITQTYEAVDADGNVSAQCTQVITVRRADINAVVFPEDLSQANGTALACDQYLPPYGNGNPDPLVTGVPFLDGSAIFPTTDLSCNIIVTYNDVVLPSIGGVQKIMREFIVTEWWCNGSVTNSDIQIIEIIDDQGPTISNCPASYSVSTTSGNDCEALVILPAIEAVDNCGTVADVDVVYPGGFLNNQNGGLVSLPIGVNTITYTVYDNNNNASECTFEITVSDDTAPVVVCDQNTVVSLALDGTALVNAISFDDGSYDDCGNITMLVKRMDNGANCTFDNQFGPTVQFCCADIGTEVMVILEVTDDEGNSNQCMVSVEVQDKLLPAISCPASVTVNCETPFDIENLDLDFGTATGEDNCSADVVELTPSVNINMCNEGTIVRFFTATDANGSVSCSQTITFVNYEPFVGTDITWPADVTLSECTDPETLLPENTNGYPVLDEDACDQVGSDYDDKVFTMINGENACFKIIRTWEVLDWCQTDGNGQFLTWTYQQVIMVINTVAPEFTSSNEDLVECTFDNDCEDGFIELGASATDECVNQVLLTYRVDLDNNGSFDIISNTVSAESIDASGNYPVGNHRIVYTAEDGCGNTVSQTQLFSIVNCKSPTPYCYNGLAIELMPIDTDNDGEADAGMIETWASDFDAGSFHSCGLPVTVSFSADPLDTGRMFTCDDLGDNTLQIWAHVVLPNGDILQDFCTTNVDIQDNNGVCGTTNTNTLVVIEGNIENEMLDKATDVDVVLEGGELAVITNEFGEYAFPQMTTGGQYDVVPSKNEEDKLNGITTLDIVLIQKHILGLEILPTPYKVIAADVNNDQIITGLDIINLRKLLLGVYAELPSNKDWRFVDANYDFINPTSPLDEDFTEEYTISNLNADMQIDFVAIKVGDVNNTSSANLTSGGNAVRSGKALNFNAKNQEFKAADRVSMEITVADVVATYGMQFTMKFNDMNLRFADVKSGAIEMNENNIGLTYLDQGAITVSWSSAELTTFEDNTVLFAVEFEAKSSGQLSGNVSINSEITNSEAYDTNLEVMDVELEFRDDNGLEVDSSPFTLYQNIPNPFAQSTNISFNLPKASAVTLSVFDVAGKLIYSQQGAYGKGMQSISLDVNAFDASGVLYYQVETKEHTATRKMVVLK